MKSVILICAVVIIIGDLLCASAPRPYTEQYMNSRFATIEGKQLASGDEMVLDQETGFLWERRGSSREMTYDEAIQYCTNLKLGGFNNWRLPSIWDLASIGIETFYNLNFIDQKAHAARLKLTPYIYRGPFPSSPLYFWSVTEREKDASIVWKANYWDGHIFPIKKSSKLYTRCTRVTESRKFTIKTGTIELDIDDRPQADQEKFREAIKEGDLFSIRYDSPKTPRSFIQQKLVYSVTVPLKEYPKSIIGMWTYNTGVGATWKMEFKKNGTWSWSTEGTISAPPMGGKYRIDGDKVVCELKNENRTDVYVIKRFTVHKLRLVRTSGTSTVDTTYTR